MEKVIFHKLKTLDEDFYKQVKNQCFDIINRVGWNNGLNQIILQTPDPDVEDFITGTGKISDAKFKYEPAYKHIQPLLKGTALNELFQTHKVFRSRLMLAKSRTCYSIHKDATARLHIALDTNEQALFLFPKHNQFYHIPEDKSVYYVDTKEDHSFANCGLYDRVHLVMCVSNLFDINSHI